MSHNPGDEDAKLPGYLLIKVGKTITDPGIHKIEQLMVLQDFLTINLF